MGEGLRKSLAYINNRFVQLSENVLPLEERGLQFGDSVYEVIKVYNSVPFTLMEHIERLFHSASSIFLTIPTSNEEMIQIVNEGIRSLDMKQGTVYIQVTRGNAERNHAFPETTKENVILIWKAAEETFSSNNITEGASLLTVPDERWHNCFIKSTCLLPNVLAKEKAVKNGYDEALFIRNGEIKECSSMNIFLVKDGIIKTPPADQSILNGITRKKVIEVTKEVGMVVSEIKLTIDDLEASDEVFITSTTKEVVPVTKVDHFIIGNGKIGDTFKRIHHLFKTAIEKECLISQKKELTK